MNLHFSQMVHFLKAETKVFNSNYYIEVFYNVMHTVKDEYIFLSMISNDNPMLTSWYVVCPQCRYVCLTWFQIDKAL